MKSFTLALFVMTLFMTQTNLSLALRLAGPIASLSEYKVDESDCVRFAFKSFKKCANFLKRNFEKNNDILYKNIIKYNKEECNDDKDNKKCVIVGNIIKELKSKKGINDNTKLTVKSQVQSVSKQNLRKSNDDKSKNFLSLIDIKDKNTFLYVKIIILVLLFFVSYMIYRMRLLSIIVERMFNPLDVKCDYETITEAMSDQDIMNFLFEKEDSFYKQKYGKKFLLSEYDSVLIVNELYNILNGDINTMPKSQIELSITLFAMIMEMKKRKYKKIMNIKISIIFGILFIVSLCLIIFYFK